MHKPYLRQVVFFVLSILSCSLFFTSAYAADTPSVNEQLKAKKDAFTQSASEDKKQDYEKGIAYVRSSGVMESAVNVGDKAPGFTLPDAVGNKVSLHDVLEKGPVVLVWYRGGWCPYCNIYLQGLQQRLDEIEAKGAQLVAISPELPDNALSTKQKHDLKFHVLSDAGNKTASDFGIVYTLPGYVIKRYDASFSLPEYNGDDSYTLPLSASYVIGEAGKVTYAFLDADYRNRASIDDLLAALDRYNASE